MLRRSVLFVLATLALSSCAPMRWYPLPLSPTEGEVMTPALLTAAQSQGLEAFRGASGGAVAKLEDGTMLSWQDSADHRDFILLVSLPKTPEDRVEAAFTAAKQRADQLWQVAMAQRQSMLPPTMAPYPQQPVNYPPPPPARYQAGPQAQSCRNDLDCGGVAFCKNRGDGVTVCMSNGVQGAYCQASSDCGPALFCKQWGAVYTCQP